MTDRASHLALILDLSPAQWHLSNAPSNSSPLSLKTFLSHVLTFVNSHIASKPENSLAIFGALPGKSILIHSTEDANADSELDVPGDPNSYRPFKLVDSLIARNVERELEDLDIADDEPPVALVGALTKALCHVNRISQAPVDTTAGPHDPDSAPEPRILILSVSPDLSAAYIPIMNSIFSAQKLKVTIDVCKIFGPDTVFLQQVAHLTGGSYINLEQKDALLQYLIMSFLPPPSMRHVLTVPKQDKVDFRAACFCHKNIVDIAFVCSVCLSIFCSPVPVCSTCRTKFPFKSLQRLQAARPPQAPRAGSTPNGTGTPTNGTSPRPRSVAPLQPTISSNLR